MARNKQKTWQVYFDLNVPRKDQPRRRRPGKEYPVHQVFFWGGAFIVITAWNVLGYLFPGSFIRMWPDEWWFNWFMFYLGIHTLLAPVTAVWMTWGGVRDLREMFRLLRECRHSTDDGYVERKEN